VLAEHRGEPVAAVVPRVGVGADAEEADVQQPHTAGQHPVPVEPAGAQLLGHDLAYRGQPLGDGQDVLVLGPLLRLAEFRVVEVLAAARRVGAHRLQMSRRPRADPHVLPRGRDRQRLDALDDLTVVYGLT
jgi:hypothetical protein